MIKISCKLCSKDIHVFSKQKVVNRLYCKSCGKQRIRESNILSRSRPEYEKGQAIVRKRSNLKLKIDVLTHYGKSGRLLCQWPGCRVRDVDCLSLDHIANDGAAHKKRLSKSKGYKTGTGHSLYRLAKKLKFPKGFQTLCCNHQMKKEILRRKDED